MDASTAREMLNNRLECDLDDIFIIIRCSIRRKGKDYIKISDDERYISDIDRKLLRSKGYRVEYNPYSKVTTISW